MKRLKWDFISFTNVTVSPVCHQSANKQTAEFLWTTVAALPKAAWCCRSSQRLGWSLVFGKHFTHPSKPRFTSDFCRCQGKVKLPKMRWKTVKPRCVSRCRPLNPLSGSQTPWWHHSLPVAATPDSGFAQLTLPHSSRRPAVEKCAARPRRHRWRKH